MITKLYLFSFFFLTSQIQKQKAGTQTTTPGQQGIWNFANGSFYKAIAFYRTNPAERACGKVSLLQSRYSKYYQ